MGNYKFKLSDMIPNAWFYKLKDMNKLQQVRRNHDQLSRKEKQSSPVPSKITNDHGLLSQERKSYHFTRPDHFHQNYSPIKTTISSCKYLPSAEPPRKSSRRKRRSIKRNRPQAEVNPLTIDHTQDQTISFSSSDHGSLLPEYGSDDSSTSKCKLLQNDDMMVELLDMVSLPPIITKKHHHPVIRRSSLNSSSTPGVKLRTNTPRTVNRRRRKRMIEGGRKSLSLSSYAVVKSSNDPRRDFRESMVEMIVENNIRGAKDLEDLLACYLSLNSNHYHHLIIDVFKQLWFDFIHVRLIN